MATTLKDGFALHSYKFSEGCRRVKWRWLAGWYGVVYGDGKMLPRPPCPLVLIVEQRRPDYDRRRGRGGCGEGDCM